MKIYSTHFLSLLFLFLLFSVKDGHFCVAQQRKMEKQIIVVPGNLVQSSQVYTERQNAVPIIESIENLQSPVQWHHVGEIKFLSNRVNEICDTPDQEIYDTLQDVMRFAETLDPKQMAKLTAKGGSLSINEVTDDQKAILIETLKKYKSYLRVPEGGSLVDISQTSQGQKDIKISLAFHLSVSFFSDSLNKGAAGGTIVKLPDRWQEAKPFVPFTGKTEAANLRETLKKVYKPNVRQKLVADSVLSDEDKERRVPLSAIFAVDESSFVLKPLEQWIEGVNTYMHTKIAVDSSLKNKLIGVVVTPKDDVALGDFLTALGLAANDAAQWRRVGDLYFLFLRSKAERCRQQLAQPSYELYKSTVDYTFVRFADETEKMYLPRELFLEPRRNFKDFPTEAQNLMYYVVNRMSDSPNKRLLLDAANNDNVQVEFSLTPVMTFLYKETENPPFKSSALIQSLIIASPLRLDSLENQ